MLEAPEYFRKIVLPLFAYGNNETAAYGSPIPYNLAWAPHHLGHWPVCDLLPSKQEQMPVEESGNLLIIVAGLIQAQSQGTARRAATHVGTRRVCLAPALLEGPRHL